MLLLLLSCINCINNRNFKLKIMEVDRGITEYLYDGKGCGGIIKMRYSDFIVHEVDANGNRVLFDSKCWDTSMKEHEDFVSNRKTKNGNTAEINKIEEPPMPIEDQIKEVESSLPNDHAPFSKKQIQTLAMMQVDKSSNAPLSIEVEGMSKLERTNIHEFVRKYFNKLDSTTKKEGLKSVITIRRAKGGAKRRIDKREERLIYKFVLYKENIGTMDAVSLLCKKLRLKNFKGFNYAGTKDKRGVTTQEMTATIAPQRLMQINGMVNNIRVGNFRPTDAHLKLGDLSGNHFTIILRNVDTTGCNLDEACKSLVEKGFINYFGMQRFGTGQVATHKVGMAIINSEWKLAIEYILSNSYSDTESEMQKKLRNWHVEGNAANCVNYLGKKANVERSLLRGIMKSGTRQLCQALNGIARNTRLLYLHSYQSYVWNRMVSKRIKQFGLKVVVGDIVSLDTTCEKKPSAEESGEPPCKTAKISTDEQQDSTAVVPVDGGDDDDEEGTRKITRVKRVTAADVNDYSISQVVLPLPGCDVIYPKYGDAEEGCWYEEMIEREDGVKMSNFNHPVKTYYLSGAYRYMLGYPKELGYELIKYDNFMLPLMLSDRDRMMNKDELPLVEDGQYEALKITFLLPTSTYATVALRDVTKTDLGPMHQMEAEKDHKKTAPA